MFQGMVRTLANALGGTFLAGANEFRKAVSGGARILTQRSTTNMANAFRQNPQFQTRTGPLPSIPQGQYSSGSSAFYGPGYSSSIRSRRAAIKGFRQYTRAVALQRAKPNFVTPSQMPGLTPAQKITVGMSGGNVSQANRQAQVSQAKGQNRQALQAEEKKVREELIESMKQMAKGLPGFILGLATAVRGLEKLNFVTVESYRGIGTWSAKLQSAFVRLDAQTIQLEQRTARANETSASALADAQMELRESLQKPKEAFNTAQNAIQTGLTKVGTVVVDGFNTVMSPIYDLLRLIEGNTASSAPKASAMTYAVKGVAKRPFLPPLSGP